MIRFARILQRHWDWRAACNFVFGGTGGALLALAVFIDGGRAVASALLLLALALVGAGLGCVWLEIGRPWRALNVFWHPQRSWMTREAFVASATFVLAVAGLALGVPTMLATSGVGGLAFLYCQARILRAARGVPAWRQRAIVPFVLATGLAEGAGLAFALLALSGRTPAWLGWLLLGCLAARALAWHRYRAALKGDGAPEPTLALVARLHAPLLVSGTAVPVILLALALTTGGAVTTVSNVAAGASALLAGWAIKFVLVTRAAHLQGYAFGKLHTGHPLARTRS